MNRLIREKSAYLRHAAKQKINWYPWSEEAFERARQESKPVYLSSGAIWCHWCHVMSKESFEDDEVARILNTYYIAIKLDRDERPDIDRRYQQAVAAMGVGGGWPLNVFLTHEKKPFYGGTYFPLHEGFGRMGFRTLLTAMSELYKKNRKEIDEQGEVLVDMFRQRFFEPGTLSEAWIREAAQIILSNADRTNGGFGGAPKFPVPGAMEFLVNRYILTRDENIGAVIKESLLSMAKGGYYDQLGGGFHRYSTDESWIVPHFEKMADDNAWLLRNYTVAYTALQEDRLGDVANGIMHFLINEMSDPEGGFYSSQDADIDPDDEGGYFTWTREDFRRIFSPEEDRILSLHLLHDRGVMHHNPLKQVLFIARPAEEIAAELGIDVAYALKVIKEGKKRLLEERSRRERPYIDKAFYTSLNGMVISALLIASGVFRCDGAHRHALKSLARIIEMNTQGTEVFHADGIKGTLDDYANLAEALIKAYEVTGREDYRTKAAGFMDECIKRFWDDKGGGFFDTDEEVVGVRLKSIEDVPHPSANAVAITVLLKLSFIAGNTEYRRYAEKALESFLNAALAAGIHGGYYFNALDMYFNGVELSIHAPPDSELAAKVRSLFYPYSYIRYGEDKGIVVPCFKGVCYEPAANAARLEDILKGFTGRRADV